jgi:uncharacterized membrane protein
MIREQLIEKGVGDNKKFRWRSHEPSRIEGLSDAVFGFAVTLLVVSLEVPKTFAELMEVMRGFGAFAVCFALLIVVWYNQYKFFRRYALQDNYTIVLNAALLFVVLFYVYPLKFVFTFLIGIFTRQGLEVRLPNGTTTTMIQAQGQVTTLMMIFSLGYVAVFGLFVLMYAHAHKNRKKLKLNELEVFDTVTDIRESTECRHWLYLGGLRSFGTKRDTFGNDLYALSDRDDRSWNDPGERSPKDRGTARLSREYDV